MLQRIVHIELVGGGTRYMYIVQRRGDVFFFQPYTNDSQQQRPNEILIRYEEYNGDNFGIKDGSW